MINNKNKSELTNEFRLSKLNNSPVLFNTKIKKLVIKPLKHIYSDTGKSKHFTPAAQEWFNSIYSFNKNFNMFLNLFYLFLEFFFEKL